LVGEVRVRALLEQKSSELVVAILRRDEQGAPAVARDLVDVRSRRQQNLRRLDIVRAGGIRQRREPASICREIPLETRRRVVDHAAACASGIRRAGTRSTPPASGGRRRLVAPASLGVVVASSCGGYLLRSAALDRGEVPRRGRRRVSP